ncbi:MAG TPA: hypothetical protein VHW23_31865, partial [Kofleriaceae bacterium]|nr:hypothetical protein [Kofleriaceae bacterium]
MSATNTRQLLAPRSIAAQVAALAFASSPIFVRHDQRTPGTQPTTFGFRTAVAGGRARIQRLLVGRGAKRGRAPLDRARRLPIIAAMNRCAVVIAGVVLMSGGWVDAAPRDCPEDTTPTLFAVFGSPVLCTSDRGSCLTIGRAKSADRAVAHPTRADTHLRDDHGRMQACAAAE